jgi:hypothetical protein
MRKCSYCKQAPKTKLAAFYFGWYPPEGDRVGFRVLCCVDDYVEELLPSVKTWALAEANYEEPLCWSCGAEVDSLRDKLFVSAYLPRTDKVSFEVQMCSGCLLKQTTAIMAVGERLQNRASYEPQAREDAWVAIGIMPVA